jgi:phosphate transport system substrate-binding protein
MRPGSTSRARWALAALGLLISVIGSPFAAAQDQAHLRVTVSTSGRVVLDGLLGVIATRAGISGQLAIDHAPAISALRDFCRNEPGVSPDIVLATHRMRSALAAECAKNGADDIATVELARDPLILAVRTGSELTRLTSKQVYFAVAREVPFQDEFVRNTSARWSDIDPSLPQQDIRFELPMRDEGSRATFDALVLQAGCRDEGAVKQIFDANQRTKQCVTIRSDRVREIPRAQAVKMLLVAPVGTVGVVSQRELAQSNGQFVALTLDGMAPTAQSIQNGSYDFSTSFWLYAKRRYATDPVDLAIAHIIEQAQSDAIIGPKGPLPGLGLVPLSDADRADQRENLAAESRPYSVMTLANWVGDTAVAAWHMFGPRPSQSVTAAAEPPMDFTTLMDIAGYDISAVQSSIGIIPSASMTFAIAREMSDADHQYLERVLRRDAVARPSALAAMQRRIISSIMGVQEVGGFEVSKVEIDFLPLPSVSLQVTPKGASAPQQQQQQSNSTTIGSN